MATTSVSENSRAQPSAFTVQTLRTGFKAICKSTDNQHQNFQIRVHRALSWLERAHDLDIDDQPDGRLLYGWIAFNSLYGQWDLETGYAAGDREGWKSFLDELFAIDHDQLIAHRLNFYQDEILWLLECRYLDSRFWQNPDEFGSGRGAFHKGVSLYREEAWHKILVYALDRIYVLRNQIVHGAATRGSSLNRDSLRCGLTVLEALMPVILRLVIERRADDDWPPLCYPPVEN